MSERLSTIRHSSIGCMYLYLYSIARLSNPPSTLYPIINV